jgi:hypothetical protein
MQIAEYSLIEIRDKETIHRAPSIPRHFAEWVGNQQPLTFLIRSTKPVND